MDKNNVWEKIYGTVPLNKIHWQSTPGSWFYQLVDNHTIPTGTALDLGCGTGEKAIYLAKNNFSVSAVDISKSAINYARKFAAQEKVEIDFFVQDATDLSFLEENKFDFVLDFANLHGIPREKQSVYTQEILKHLDDEGLLYLRCFSKRTPSRTVEYFADKSVDNWKIWYFSENDILELFGRSLKILEKNEEDYIVPTRDIYFDEYLMKKI